MLSSQQSKRVLVWCGGYNMSGAISERRQSYDASMDRTLGLMLDFFVIVAMVASALASLRINQIGTAYVAMVVILVGFCVLPSVFMRADNYLKIRGIMILSGFAAALLFGIANLGLTSVALIGIPILVAMIALFSGRFLPYFALASMILAQTVIAYFFTKGIFASPTVTLDTWNRSPLNWIVALGSSAIVSILVIIVIRSLQAFWLETYDTLDGQNTMFELTILNSNGTEIPCDVSMSRLPAKGQNLIRANLIDISERRAERKRREDLQNQLSASQRLESIGKLTGGIAHDFNNLLAVILGNLELLQEELGKDKAHDLVQPCIDATLRGAELTNSMLSFARKAPLRPKIVNLNAVSVETRNWAGRTLPTSIDLEMSLADDLWDTQIDPSATQNALLNLILNASYAMPDGGTMRIRTANATIDAAIEDGRRETLFPGRYVMVSVSDTGVGISPDHLSEVFEPFVTTKPIGAGSGLGLSTVQGFLAQSGGAVHIFSTQGVGTDVKLYFPAYFGDADPPIAQDDDAIPNTTQRAQILLAEDEPEVAKVLATMLLNAGYSVVIATSGDAAMATFLKNPHFDLLISDIVMPGHLQGVDLARELRALNDALPIIFMSGYASARHPQTKETMDGTVRLMKPVSRVDLLRAVAKSLQPTV